MILHWQRTQSRLIDPSINLNLRKRNSIYDERTQKRGDSEHQWIRRAMRSGRRAVDGRRELSAVVCTPEPPRPSRLPSASRIFTSRLFSPHALDSSPDHRVRLGPSECRRHLLVLLLLAHYLWVRKTAEARPVLAWRGL